MQPYDSRNDVVVKGTVVIIIMTTWYQVLGTVPGTVRTLRLKSSRRRTINKYIFVNCNKTYLSTVSPQCPQPPKSVNNGIIKPLLAPPHPSTPQTHTNSPSHSPVSSTMGKTIPCTLYTTRLQGSEHRAFQQRPFLFILSPESARHLVSWHTAVRSPWGGWWRLQCLRWRLA